MARQPLQPRPVIFLDIDGVLNGHVQLANGYCGIEPMLARRLNRILQATGAALVISSAWRYMVPDAMTLAGFEYLLLTHGVDCKGLIIGVTCRDEELESRGQQIRHWLNENGGRPYVVIDDLDLGITEAGHPFVQTDGGFGLRGKDVLDAIRILTEAKPCA